MSFDLKINALVCSAMRQSGFGKGFRKDTKRAGDQKHPKAHKARIDCAALQ